MKDFISASFPLIMLGIALAILSVNCGTKKRRNKIEGVQIATGAGLGLLLGVMLNNCGLWENHILGLLLGPLWGIALGTLYKKEEH